jgi:hypothetical protein
MACIISWILFSYWFLLRYKWMISLRYTDPPTPMEKTLGESMEHIINDYAPP